jgi:hypothetical protein
VDAEAEAASGVNAGACLRGIVAGNLACEKKKRSWEVKYMVKSECKFRMAGREWGRAYPCRMLVAGEASGEKLPKGGRHTPWCRR